MQTKNRLNNPASTGSPDVSAKKAPDNQKGTPSPSPVNLTLPQTTELLPSLPFFDRSTQRIQRLVSDSRRLHLTQREQLRELVEILMPGTKAISISRLETLLDWPLLQAAWDLFARDVLEHPSSILHLPTAKTCNRFSTILLHPIPPTTTAPSSHTTRPAPQFRPIYPTYPTPQTSDLLTTLRSLFRGTSHPPATHHNSSMCDDDYTSDMGFPNPSLLPHRLLAGLCRTRPLDLARTSPVDAAVLAEWHGQGQSQSHNNKDNNNNNNNRVETNGCWRRTGRGWEERACSVEDYYARFVLRVLDGVYHQANSSSSGSFSLGDDGAAQAQGQPAGGRVHLAPRDQRGREMEEQRTRQWQKRVEWLRDPAEVGGLKEQMWILFHVLFFLHCEKREEIRAAQKAESNGWVKGLFCWRG